MAAALKVVFVALSLSLDVFAVSVGVGMRGVPPGMKWRIGLAFACAEIAMNLIGAGLGLLVGRLLGDIAGYIGFIVLIALGLYMINESRRELSGAPSIDLSKGWGLAVASLSISLDSLGVGFSILYIGVPPVVSLAAIGVVSITATALGLTLGQRFGMYAERYAARLGGVLLALTGIAFIALKFFYRG
ncbi:MAG: manganese efflux pump [Candidatus Eremiobacteraeota bacterium]|nr:manganese efflux pump [Candidatus Eremiobacteraeota bacterium]